MLGKKEYSLENCTCTKDYHPHLNADNKVQCYGVKITQTYPCGYLKRPACVCSKYEHNTYVINPYHFGWCILTIMEVIIRRWPCDNEEEWERYRAYRREIE